MSTDSIRDLERAYARLVLETMPVLASPLRDGIRGQLIVLDALDEAPPSLRFVPAPPPAGADVADARGMVMEIIDGIVGDARAAGRARSTPEDVAWAVSTIREKLAEDDVDPDVLLWALAERLQPLEGSIVDAEVRGGAGDAYALVPRYLERAALLGGDAAFPSLVTELLTATRCREPAAITPELLAAAHLAVLPFRALGAIRGFAVWHLFGGEELAAASTVLGPAVADRLETLYSGAVIDVFTAWFLSRVGGLTALGGTGTGQVTRLAFRYLYPCRDLTLHSVNTPPEPSDDADLRVLRFRDDDVSRFVRSSAVSWRLVYPRSGATDGRVRAYHDLLEVKIRDLALKAASEMDRQYGRLLGVFGHHTGSLLKASGAFQLWAACARGDEPSRHDVKHVLDKLLPVWGISQATSLVQKQAEEGGLTVPADWVRPEWLAREDLPERVTDAVIALVRYVFDNATQEEPFLPWVLRRGEVEQPFTWDPDPDRRASRLETLPPFDDNPVIFDKTLAVCIGLFELVNNLRKYPPSLAWGRSIRRAMGRLPEPERRVEITVDTRPDAIRLRIEQPILLAEDGSFSRSRSLARIRIFEYQCLRGMVATREPEPCGSTSHPRIVRLRQEWTFRWSELLELIRREHGQEPAGPRD